MMAPAEGAWDEFCARFPLRRDRGPGARHRRRAGGPGLRPADGPADLRRCRLRQDRGRAARRLRRRDVGRAGGRGGADHAAGAPAFPHVLRTLRRAAGQGRAALAHGDRRRKRPRCSAGSTDGSVNIVIGTHALLAKSIEFADLGLLVVDEEQHFGVAHKERLKQLKADVHVLTLTATPIPRTLAAGADRRARDEPDRHAAGRSAGGAHLHHAVRQRGDPRGDPARALPRRPGVLRGAAHRGPAAHGRTAGARSCRRRAWRRRMAGWRRPSWNA